MRSEWALFNTIKAIVTALIAPRIIPTPRSLLPVSDYEMRDGKPIIQTIRRPPEQILALNKWMKEYAQSHHYVYLDYFSAMADDKGFLKNELSNDGLHPNAEGYKVMAPLAEAAIAASLSPA